MLQLNTYFSVLGTQVAHAVENVGHLLSQFMLLDFLLFSICLQPTASPCSHPMARPPLRSPLCVRLLHVVPSLHQLPNRTHPACRKAIKASYISLCLPPAALKSQPHAATDAAALQGWSKRDRSRERKRPPGRQPQHLQLCGACCKHSSFLVETSAFVQLPFILPFIRKLQVILVATDPNKRVFLCGFKLSACN